MVGWPRGGEKNGSSGTGETEWIGGVLSMPAYVAGADGPCRPDVLIWMRTDGAIVGSTVALPGEFQKLAWQSLRSAMEEPLYGRPHRPTRVRVASPELAEALRAADPGLEVVCAPTPELEAVSEELREHFASVEPEEVSYLSPGVTPERMAAFFEAAAALFRARPWAVVPSDQSLIQVTIERLEVQGAVVSVIGQERQHRGFVLFSDLKDFEVFLEVAEVIEHGQRPELPPHFAVGFVRGSELPAGMRKEIAEHRWEVAAPDAYPSAAFVDGDVVGRPLTGREITVAEAIARALSAVVTDHAPALRAACEGGGPMSRSLSVATHEGAVQVTLRAPCPQAPDAFDPERDPLAELAALESEDEAIDDEARGDLERELLRRFVCSPEARGLGERHSCGLVMDLAAQYLGRTIATLDAAGLETVLFDLFPEKVSIEASEAGRLVDELRAFYTFLRRAFGLAQADDCLRLLDGDVAVRFEEALSDERRFGPAKSLVMQGMKAGFDVRTPEGIKAWMESARSQPLPPAIDLPGFEAPRRPPKESAKARKARRKAARKARKGRR